MTELPTLPVPVKDTQEPDDTVLWREFKKGKEWALASIYQRHLSALYNYGVHSFKDSDLVLDCLQELFSRLWSGRRRIAEVDCVRIYLFKSFQRLLIHQKIRKRKLSVSVASLPWELSPSSEDVMIDRESHHEQAWKLMACIRALTPGQREVVLLRYFNNLSYSEISDVMEMQIASVYNLASKALENLRKKLQQQSPQTA